MTRSHPSSRKKIRSTFLLTLLLLAFVLLVSWQARIAAAAEDDLPYPIIELLEEAIIAPLPLLSPHTAVPLKHPKLDSTLNQLVSEAKRSSTAAEAFVAASDLRLIDDRVQTRVLTTPGKENNAEKAIRETGGTVTYSSELAPELQAWIPVTSLEAVADDSAVSALSRPAYAVLLDNNGIDATSEGLAPMGAQAWHNAGERGAGVKIAIIDGGFFGYHSLLGFDLPASVTAKNFVDGENDSQVDGTSRHGTACTEIIYDIAPDAQFFLLKIATNLDLQEAVNYAISQGVDVISTSIGWYNLTPGDGTGQFADLANLARNNGIIWLTAAGNDRDAHWGGLFESGGNQYHNFTGTQEVNFFGPGTGTAYGLPAGTLVRVYLRWDDWQQVNQDYALHVVAWTGSSWQIAATGDRLQNGSPGQRPVEEVFGYTAGADKPYGFVIERISGNRDVNLEMFAPNVARLDEFVPERSLPNLADSPALVTVGAVSTNWPYGFQDYSAQGPTNGPGGTSSGGFIKPDLAGYSGVSTETYGFLSFSGTSASAPHAAGAAALFKGANPTLSPDQIQNMLQGRAVDQGSPGKDTMFGFGRIFLDAPPSSIIGLDNHAYLPVALR